MDVFHLDSFLLPGDPALFETQLLSVCNPICVLFAILSAFVVLRMRHGSVPSRFYLSVLSSSVFGSYSLVFWLFLSFPVLSRYFPLFSSSSLPATSSDAMVWRPCCSLSRFSCAGMESFSCLYVDFSCLRLSFAICFSAFYSLWSFFVSVSVCGSVWVILLLFKCHCSVILALRIQVFSRHLFSRQLFSSNLLSSSLATFLLQFLPSFSWQPFSRSCSLASSLAERFSLAKCLSLLR